MVAEHVCKDKLFCHSLISTCGLHSWQYCCRLSSFSATFSLISSMRNFCWSLEVHLLHMTSTCYQFFSLPLSCYFLIQTFRHTYFYKHATKYLGFLHKNNDLLSAIRISINKTGQTYVCKGLGNFWLLTLYIVLHQIWLIKMFRKNSLSKTTHTIQSFFQTPNECLAYLFCSEFSIACTATLPMCTILWDVFSEWQQPLVAFAGCWMRLNMLN